MREFGVSLTLLSASAFLCSLTSCGSPCDQGYGLAQNGDCRPFIHDAESDVDVDADSDSDSDSDSDPGTPSSSDLEIMGSWLTDNNESHTITNDTWVHEFSAEEDEDVRNEFDIQYYYNNNNFLVAYNLETNDIDGGLYSRFDWATIGDETWFCPTACCAENEDEAMNAVEPDSSDPSSSGCGEANTEWQKLIRQ